MNHENYIHLCFDLALKAKGMVSPNPLVGSVIVKNDQIIAEGFHRGPGKPHAEADAFNNLDSSAEGATLYCNLEPCCHTNKKTPPCAPLIIKHKIKRVIISNLDPNPEVAGKGVKQLEDAGIEVISGVLEDIGEEINEVFFKNMREQKTFIHMKMASTLDGNISMSNGDSKWITSEEMRLLTHEERYLYDAIAIGANTYINDNPSLTIRHPELADKELKKIVFTKRELELKEGFQRIDTNQIDDIASYLYKELCITSLYLEAGQTIATSFLNKRWIDKITFCIAPKILGDQMRAFSALEGINLKHPIQIKTPSWKQAGVDMLCTGIIEY